MSDSLRLHLVRHAQTLFNVRHQLQGWCDSPLTPLGVAQAAALGERFRSVPLRAAFSSDLTRTRTTTTAALAGHPEIEPAWMPELREWCFGGWEGQPNEALWGPLFAHRGFQYGVEEHWASIIDPSPEPLIDELAASDPSGLAEDAVTIRSRLQRALQMIVGIGHGDVLVVTHGALLFTMVPMLVPGARVVPGFPNCGVITVTIDNGVGTLGDADGACALGDTPAAPLVLP